MIIKAIAFSERGTALGKRLDVETAHCESGKLNEWAAENWENSDALVFIGSCGIAVRAVAPLVKSKISDPAVVVIDEYGTFAISLLSGHIGSANELAKRLALKVNAIPVVTTASDLANVPRTPGNIVVGIGCRRDTDAETIERAVTAILWRHGLPMCRVCCLTSIDAKRHEQGLLKFAELYGLPLKFYSADELNAVAGEFAQSEFVKSAVGVDNVCERAACLCSMNGNKILSKTAKGGVTVAAYEMAEDFKPTVPFGQCDSFEGRFRCEKG
jgi:cobalt-precorrin 5A hydrolase